MKAQQQALLVKGYLLGKEAPSPLIEAIDYIISVTGQSIGQSIEITLPKIPDLEDKTIFPSDNRENFPIGDVVRDDYKEEQRDTNQRMRDATDQLQMGKKKRTMSPEAREKVRQAQLARWAKQKDRPGYSERSLSKDQDEISGLVLHKEPPCEIPANSGKEKFESNIQQAVSQPRADTLPETIIQKHSEYIGRRDPCQRLTDDDWHDIKIMLGNDISVYDIAKKYNRPRPEMKDFIDMKTAHDNQQTNKKIRGKDMSF